MHYDGEPLARNTRTGKRVVSIAASSFAIWNITSTLPKLTQCVTIWVEHVLLIVRLCFATVDSPPQQRIRFIFHDLQVICDRSNSSQTIGAMHSVVFGCPACSSKFNNLQTDAQKVVQGSCGWAPPGRFPLAEAKTEKLRQNDSTSSMSGQNDSTSTMSSRFC